MRQNKKRCGYLLAGLAVLGMAALTGCGRSNGAGQPEEAMETEEEFENLISVGFCQIGSESIWRDANSASIQNSLTRENGYFLIYSNARQKQENQIKAIRSFISQRVDYITFSPVTQDGWGTVLQEAKDVGIPVILVDRQVSEEYEDLYTAWVGTDSEEEGRKAGEWLEQYLEEQGREDEELNIAIITGTIGSSAQTGRSGGFNEVAEQHENWKIVAEVSGDFTTAKGKETMSRILAKNTDIDVLVSQNDDMTFGALEAMEAAGLETGENGTVIISFDASKEALELVQQGIINVDIECNALQGPYIDALIQRMEAGEKVEKRNIVDEQIFTADNVADAIADRQY